MGCVASQASPRVRRGLSPSALACCTASPALAEVGLPTEGDFDRAPDQRAGLAILLVTLNPQHDDSSVLSEFARQHRIDDARWMLRACIARRYAKAGGCPRCALPPARRW